MLDLFMLLFGLYALIKGEFRITKNRRVSAEVGRGLGILMLGSFAFALYFSLGGIPGISLVILIGGLILAIIIGFATSEKD